MMMMTTRALNWHQVFDMSFALDKIALNGCRYLFCHNFDWAFLCCIDCRFFFLVFCLAIEKVSKLILLFPGFAHFLLNFLDVIINAEIFLVDIVKMTEWRCWWRTHTKKNDCILFARKSSTKRWCNEINFQQTTLTMNKSRTDYGADVEVHHQLGRWWRRATKMNDNNQTTK